MFVSLSFLSVPPINFKQFQQEMSLAPQNIPKQLPRAGSIWTPAMAKLWVSGAGRRNFPHWPWHGESESLPGN